MSLCESLIAQRILSIKTESDCIECDEWIQSFSEIEWTTKGEEPDVTAALVFNFVLKNQHALQKQILSTLLKKKEITQEYLKFLLKKNCQPFLLELCVERFNEINDQDCQAEVLFEPTLQIVFTRKILVGTKESFENEAFEKE